MPPTISSSVVLAPPAFNLSQHQSLLKSVSSSHHVAKVLEFQHHSFQWMFRTDPLGWTAWISLQSKGLSRVFSNTTVQKHQFFAIQLSFRISQDLNIHFLASVANFHLSFIALPSVVGSHISEGIDGTTVTKASVDAPVYFIKFFSEQTHPNVIWGTLTVVRYLCLFFLRSSRGICNLSWSVLETKDQPPSFCRAASGLWKVTERCSKFPVMDHLLFLKSIDYIAACLFPEVGLLLMTH